MQEVPPDSEFSDFSKTDSFARQAWRSEEIYGAFVKQGDRVYVLTEDIDFIVHETIRALAFGDRKHGLGTWIDVPAEKFLSALMRHVGKRMGGEIHDPESGIDHFGHAMANIVLLYRKYHASK